MDSDVVMTTTSDSKSFSKTSINTCATKLFQSMKQSKIFSPLSIGVAMGLVHLGARTTTEEELTQFFGGKLTLDDLVKLHNYFNSNATKMSNVLFINKDNGVNSDYAFQISPVALCRIEDFSQSKEVSDLINKVISSSTNGLIKDVVTPLMI